MSKVSPSTFDFADQQATYQRALVTIRRQGAKLDESPDRAMAHRIRGNPDDPAARLSLILVRPRLDDGEGVSVQAALVVGDEMSPMACCEASYLGGKAQSWLWRATDLERDQLDESDIQGPMHPDKSGLCIRNGSESRFCLTVMTKFFLSSAPHERPPFL